MNYRNKFSTVSLIGCLLMSSLTMTGCMTTSDNIVYFNNADQVLVGQALPDYEIKAKPGDELRILVSSTVPEATVMYNLPPYIQNHSNAKQTSRETTLTTYIVSPSGNITLPVIGDLNVVGKTSEEIKCMVSDRVAEQVKDPIVTVEFVGFRVTVLGEVGASQRINVQTQRFSILDAIASCGGVRLTGQKEKVRLIREENGTTTTHVLDLRDASLINSPYFYLQQNDVLIVDADDVAKSNALYNQQNGFRLSVVSTCVSAISVIASLLIALTK